MYLKNILKISVVVLPLLFSTHAQSLESNLIVKQKLSIAPMLKSTMPAVVSISVEGTKEHKQKFPQRAKDLFKDKLPPEEIIQKPFSSNGSGVIIDADKGYIVTNQHVISEGDNIYVTLDNGTILKAELIGEDVNSDIAILKIDNTKKLNLIDLEFADSNKLEIGDFVVAIGNPYGLTQSASTGIISALGRSGLGLESIENFIQTDAAINKGNSGGALIDSNGYLVGINTAIFAPSGGSVGIGFSIPSNMIKKIADQIINHGSVKKGLLGVIGVDLTNDISKALNININKGAFIREVADGSAASLGGILAGDVIVSINNKSIMSFNELRAIVGSTRAGSEIVFDIIRDNNIVKLKIKLGGNKEEKQKLVHPSLNGVLLHANEDGGVFIGEVKPKSISDKVGFKKGDLIIEVNKKEIKSIEDISDIFENSHKIIIVKILRGKNNIFLLINK